MNRTFCVRCARFSARWAFCNRYSKETILEAYLNTIPLTGTIYGMEAGAQEYFGKSVEELSLAECAELASITKNPKSFNPATNPENLLSAATMFWL